MKKLLLKFAALTLCVISPHMSQAQEVKTASMKLTGWGDTNPTLQLGKQMTGVVDYYTTTTNAMPLAQTVLTDSPLVNLPAKDSEEAAKWNVDITAVTPTAEQTASFGFGQITDGTINIDFDYSDDRPSGQYFYNGKCYSQRWAYSTQYVPELKLDDNIKAAGLNVYAGVGMRFTVPGKRIKKLIIHTGLPSEQDPTYSTQWNFNSAKLGYNIQNSTKMDSYAQTNVNPNATMTREVVDGLVNIVITSNESFGTTEGFIVKTTPVAQSAIAPIPLSSKSTTKPSYVYCDNAVFNIASIDVEYFDEKPFVTESTGNNITTASSFQYYNPATSQFETVSANKTIAKADAQTVEKAKIGDVIIEVDNSGITTATAMSLYTAKGLGIYPGSRFRMYLDPEKYADAKTYSMAVKGQTGTVTIGTVSGYSWNYINITNLNRTGITFEGGSISMPAISTSAKTPDHIFKAIYETGVSSTGNNGWIEIGPRPTTTALYDLTVTTAAMSQNTNDNPAIFIAAVDVEASTDEIPTPATGTPELGTGAERSYLIDGVYKYLASTSLTPKSAADQYLKHSFYYIISDEALTADSFDKSKATKISEGNAIKIDQKCVLNVLTIGEYSKGEVEGALNTYSFEPLGVTLFDDVKALNKPENDGKLVAINCLVNPIQNSSYGIAGLDLDHNSAANGYMYHTYARDIHGNPFKYTIFTNTSLTTTNNPIYLSSYSFSTTTRKYLGEAAIIGVFHYNDGHPEIRVIDQKAETTYDYSTFADKTFVASTDAEAKTRSGLTTILENYPDFITEPSKDAWGAYVRIQHLTYKEKSGNDYLFTKSDGTEAKVKTFITRSLNPAPAAGSEYTLYGIVEYNETDGYYLTPTYVLASMLPLVVDDEDETKNTVVVDATAHEPADDDVDVSVDVTLLSGKIQFKIINPNTSGTFQYFLCDLNNENKKTSLTLSTSTKIAEIASSAITWVDGVANLSLILHKGAATSDVLDVAEPVTFRIYDKVAAGFTTETIAGLREEYADKNPAEVTDEPFVTIGKQVSSFYGKIVVAGIYDKYILVRDIPDGMSSSNSLDSNPQEPTGTDMEGSNDYILVKADGGWLETSTAKINNIAVNYVFHVTHTYYDYTSHRVYNSIAQGDAIRQLVARVAPDANGNWMLDATGTEDLFDAYKKYQQTSEPRMAEVIDQLVVPENVETITEADLNKLVKFTDVNIAAGTYKIGTSDNILAWNYLSADDKIVSDKAAIDGATAGAEFTVTGLVMRAADGALAVEVISLEGGYDKVLDVCEHQEHDSYYADQEFAGTENLVKVNGVKITRTGDTANDYAYQLRIKTPVTLDWTTTAARADADKALIDAALTDGTTTAEFVVSGFLKTEGDVQTLDVIAFEQVPVINDQIRIYAYWDKKKGSSKSEFHSYFVPGFTYNPKNNSYDGGYYDATEVYNISYKMLPLSEIENLPEDPSTLTDDERKALLENVPLKKFDPATFEKVNESSFLYAESCTPGKAAIKPSGVAYIKRVGLKTATLAEIISEENTESYNHYNGTLRVLGVNPTTKTMALTDGTHIISAYVTFDEELTEDVVTGTHIGELTLSPRIKGQYYRVNWSRIDNANVPITVVIPETEIAEPAPVVLTGTEAIADINQKAVKAVGAKISKEGNSYVAEIANPNGGTFKLPLTIHLGWDPSTLSDDPDADYIVRGYVFQRVDPYTGDPLVVVNPKNVMALADEPITGGLYTHEIWATSVELRSQTPTPVITVSGAESVEDGKAVTIEDVTVSIACDEATAKIEYSTDGGNTWTAYDDTKPVVIKTTTTVAARAQGEDMSMSPVATMEIVRETISGKAAIDFAPKAGYTEVTLRHEAIDFAGKYEVRYTTDGSEPTADSQLYTAPLELEEACTVKAILKEEGKDRFGAAVSEAISVRSGDLTITATRAPGNTTVRIEVADTKHFNADGAVIYYSKNDGATFDEYQVAGGKNYVEFDTDKAITVVAYLEEQGKTIGDEVAENITVDPATTEPTDPTDPTDPEDPKDPTEPTDPTDPSDPDDDTDAIDGIAADGAAKVTVEGDCIVAPEGSMVFDLTGRRVRPEGLRAGIYIVRLADGTAVKVAVR